ADAAATGAGPARARSAAGRLPRGRRRAARRAGWRPALLEARERGVLMRRQGRRATLITACVIATAVACAAAPGGTSRPESARQEANMSDADHSIDARERMVRTQIEARGVADPRVLDAMRAIPRHRFVAEGYEAQAYDDRPL